MRLLQYFILPILLGTLLPAYAIEDARSRYHSMTKLEGSWILSPADRQEGKATQHKLVKPLIGTGTTAMQFKLIGKGSTVQEDLLPGTGKEMVTMYH